MYHRIAPAVALFAALVLFGSIFLIETPASASVDWGNEYNANVITSTTASGTALTVYKNGAGSVGSITISSTSPALTTYPSLIIYDATSTMSTSTARKIAVFGSATPSGTYVFDAVVTKGVAIEVPVGFGGAYTITWR